MEKEDPSGARLQRAWQIRIDLKGIRPPVWRRVLVSDRITLRELHGVLQAVFGWQDYHLHEFTIQGEGYGDPAVDEFGDFDLQDEAKTKLWRLVLQEGDRFDYTYDFGDGWEHSLRIEKILPAERGMKLPRCIGGKRACPPEDVGGAWGYAEFLEALGDPRHPEHETYLEWSGGGFDPEAFDLEAANARLNRRSRGGRSEGRTSAPEENETAAVPVFDFSRWTPSTTGEHETTAGGLPLRRDVETFLTYIREHKVTGTPSTGNLPLKAVAEVSARFVHPPALEMKIGERVYRIRSEDAVWPLFFVHVLVETAELISGGPGRRWRLTSLGEQFLDLPAAAQVLVLLTAWWYRTNWLIAVSSGIFGEELSPRVPQTVLSLLRELSVGQPVEFEPFVDRLIDKVGWTWNRQEPDYTRHAIGAAVEHMVIRPLADFRLLSAEYTKNPDSGFDRPELTSFALTGFGRALLDALP